MVWRSEKSLFCNRWRLFLVFGQGSEISTSELRRSFVGFGCDNSHGETLSGDNNSCSYYLSPGERSQAPLTIQALMIWDLLWVHIGFSSHKWPIRSNEYHLPLGHKVWPLTSNRYPLCFLGDCPIGVRLLLFGICIWGPTLYEQIIHFSLLDYPKFRKRFFQISKKNYPIRDINLKISNQNQNGKTKAIFSHIDMGAKLSEGIFNTRFYRWLHRCSHCSSTGKISFFRMSFFQSNTNFGLLGLEFRNYWATCENSLDPDQGW